MPLRHPRGAKTKRLRRRVHPALHGVVQLIELGFQCGKPLMHRAFALTELSQQVFNFLRRESRIQPTHPPPQANPARHLLCITRHAATQAHVGRVVRRFEIRIVQQHRLKHVAIQRAYFYR
ncbi:hypothetical protein D3C87_984410 [compost metagenome]